MSIKSISQSTVAALAFVAAGPLFAQGTPINAAAFDALVAQGPVADAALLGQTQGDTLAASFGCQFRDKAGRRRRPGAAAASRWPRGRGRRW